MRVYTVDLRGYGNSMTKDNGNVILVSGWSEKIFDMIYYIEQGSSVVNEIMKIEIEKRSLKQQYKASAVDRSYFAYNARVAG